MVINYPKIYNVTEPINFSASNFVFLLLYNSVSKCSPRDFIGLLDCRSGHVVLSYVVSVLVLICEISAFLYT